MKVSPVTFRPGAVGRLLLGLALLLLALASCGKEEKRSILAFGVERTGAVEASGAVALGAQDFATFSTSGSAYPNGLLLNAYSVYNGTLVADINLEGLAEGDSVPLVKDGRPNTPQASIGLFNAIGRRLGEIDPKASADSSVELTRIGLDVSNENAFYVELRGSVQLLDPSTGENVKETFVFTLEAVKQ